MRFSVSIFLTDRTIRPADMARECEARDFWALYLPEHTHIPASRETPAPMGEPLPDHYARCVDPFVALTAAAAATQRLRIGTAICLVAQRDPIVTAKQVATLDLLSEGRFTFGVGFGWNREEAANHGVPWPQRREKAREHVLAIRRLWTDEAASFDGAHVAFGAAWQWPKPLQDPHPPIWLGAGAGPANFANVAEYADGWMPIGGRGLAAGLEELHRACDAAGRDPAELDIVPLGSTPDAAKYEHFAKVGATEVVAYAPPGPAAAVLPFLDSYAAMAAAFSG